MKPTIDELADTVRSRQQRPSNIFDKIKYGARIEAKFVKEFETSYKGQKAGFDMCHVPKYMFMQHYQHSIDEMRHHGMTDDEILAELHTQNEMYRK